MPMLAETRCTGVFVGLSAVDITYMVDELPRRNQKISVPRQRIGAGGPSLNAAVTFAQLGGRATLVSAVGSNSLAQVIREDLKRYGVKLDDVAQEHTEPPPLSSIMVLHRTGERSVVSANAAAFSGVPEKVDLRVIRSAAILQVDGHFMPMCIAAASMAQEHNVPVVLDSGSWKPGMSKLLRFVDIVICSDDFRPPGCSSREEVFGYLKKHGISQIAITRGASSILFVDNGKRGNVPVKRVRAKDTLGAGDIFHGAFCFYKATGAGFREALRAAARVASLSCRYVGTRSWIEFLN